VGLVSEELMLRSDALTADEVEKVTFKVTRFKQGYDPKEVDDFLDRVQSEVALLTQENAELRAALKVVAKTQESSEGSSNLAAAGGSADLLARRADLERDVNALEAFEREYRTRLKAWIGGMLDELDHPDDVPMPAPSAAPPMSAPAVASAMPAPSAPPAMPAPSAPRAFSPQVDIEDTSEIPVIRAAEFQVEYSGWTKKRKKKEKKKKAKAEARAREQARRDFTLPPDDPHGPDRVTQNA
jgi:DivIVA domain-containing protein